jgi:hypothetical protein
MTKSLMTPLQVKFWQCLVSIPFRLQPACIRGGARWSGAPTRYCARSSDRDRGHIKYLVWYWLLSRFPASSIASFSFFTPLFGVMLGGIILSEPITWLLIFGVALVAAGIYVVQRQ